MASEDHNHRRSVMGSGVVFAGVEDVVAAATREVLEDYDVSIYYHKMGIAQRIARNDFFTTATLCVIGANTLWIGIEMDTNDKDDLFESEWYFQLIEFSFFAFFLLEWLVRFCAFKRKRDCARDRWFICDTLLVLLAILDLLVLPVALSGKKASSSQLSLLRIGRLLRLSRLVRFMRAVPELVSLMKSIRIAAKPVVWTLVLVFLIIYVFAVIFRHQLTPEDAYLHDHFTGLINIMWHLLLQGTLLDQVFIVAGLLLDEAPALAMAFLLLVLVTATLLLNMLIGVLVDVMNTMARAEREKAALIACKSKLMGILNDLDEDGSGTISRNEFDRLIEVSTTVEALHQLGVDPMYLVSLSDHIFSAAETGSAGSPLKAKTISAHVSQKSDEEIVEVQSTSENAPVSMQLLHQNTKRSSWAESTNSNASSQAREEEEEEEYAMTFADFVNTVVRLRSKNLASVVDIVDLRKLVMKVQSEAEQQLETISAMNSKLLRELRGIHNHPLMKLLCSHPRMQSKFSSRNDRAQHVATRQECSSVPEPSSEPVAPGAQVSVCETEHCATLLRAELAELGAPTGQYPNEAMIRQCVADLRLELVKEDAGRPPTSLEGPWCRQDVAALSRCAGDTDTPHSANVMKQGLIYSDLAPSAHEGDMDSPTSSNSSGSRWDASNEGYPIWV